MATHRYNPLLKSNNDTGFGSNTNTVGGRFINKDGTFNMRKEGLPFWQTFSVYHTMLNLPRWKFITVILLFFFSINLFYSLLYLIVGFGEFNGMIAITWWQKFKEIYFFSTETFTTVGYGRVNPVGDAANFIASIEALTGFLSFAIATGLIYGRFSKPKAYLAFSEHALISPYQDKTGLMFRFASYKDNHVLTNVEVVVTIGFQVQENGNASYKFYTLQLERSRADSLPLNFTVVHPIDDQSPLYGFSWEDMRVADVELYVLVRAFDDVYSNVVLQRTSYTYEEIKFNAKFIPMYRESDNGNTTVLELHKLNEYRDVEKKAKDEYKY
ncbi:MAG TPA: ion channel [Chitinophagaceae bacterium]|nr:ion channel [Chitinophagaceae bacterium]